LLEANSLPFAFCRLLFQRGVYLNTSGKKKFFIQYERMLGELAGATDTANKARGFRAVFQDQIANLSKAVLQGSDYVPFSKGAV
jgi:hypothetical protein